MQKSIEITVCDDSGNEAIFSLPAKVVVCDDCEGEGTVLNESMRGYAYTEQDEEFHDPEFREQYFSRGGCYDVTCPTCEGRNVITVIDRDKYMSPAQKDALQAHDRGKREDEQYEAMCASERRMGA